MQSRYQMQFFDTDIGRKIFDAKACMVVDLLKKFVYKIRSFRNLQRIKNSCILILYPSVLSYVKSVDWFLLYKDLLFSICNTVIMSHFIAFLVNGRNEIFFDENLMFIVFER